MNDEIFYTALAERFEGFELVEYLDLPTEIIVYHLREIIEDNREDLEEFLGLNTDVEDQYE